MFFYALPPGLRFCLSISSSLFPTLLAVRYSEESVVESLSTSSERQSGSTWPPGTLHAVWCCLRPSCLRAHTPLLETLIRLMCSIGAGYISCRVSTPSLTAINGSPRGRVCASICLLSICAFIFISVLLIHTDCYAVPKLKVGPTLYSGNPSHFLLNRSYFYFYRGSALEFFPSP